MPRRVAVFALLVALVLVTALAACTSAVPRYAVSAGTVRTLRTLRPAAVAVGPFSATLEPRRLHAPLGGGPWLSDPAAAEPPRPDAIPCLAWGWIRTPDGEPFAAYIRQALVDELVIAELYDEAAPVTLSGHVEELAVEPWASTWRLALRLTSSNGETLTVRETYNYPLNAWTESPCEGAVRAFMPAVQNLIATAVRHPHFAALLR